MAKMSPKMKKAYAAYEKAESPKEKMMEAKKGAALKKKVKKAAKKKMVK
jgi:hypothetical protein